MFSERKDSASFIGMWRKPFPRFRMRFWCASLQHLLSVLSGHYRAVFCVGMPSSCGRPARDSQQDVGDIANKVFRANEREGFFEKRLLPAHTLGVL